MQEFFKIISEEQRLYAFKKDQHLQDIHSLLTATPAKDRQAIDQVAAKSSEELQNLKETALKVEEKVSLVSLQANKAMSSFENLRNQKQNIEKILNILSAFQELQRVKLELPRAIAIKDLQACLKLAQAYLSVESVILQEFCQRDFHTVKDLIEQDLVQLLKQEFEDAVKQNDINRINVCACLSKVLKLESENSLERVKQVHGKELRSNLLGLEEQMFERVNNTYEEYIYTLQGQGSDGEAREYDLPFLDHFVKVLQKVNEQAERFSVNILSFYGREGLNELQFFLLEEISNPFLNGVIKKIRQFYEVDKKQQNLVKQTLLACIQARDSQVDQKVIDKLSLYNEEVAMIVSQFNQFLQHLSELSQDVTVNKNFERLSINSSIFDILQSYLENSKKEIQLSLRDLFCRSETLLSLWQFEKSKIQPLTDLKEQLQGNGFHEWLEEIFYIVKRHATMAITTQNQMIASALINFIGSDIIQEELYQFIVALINRYLKKEYFSSTSICINQRFSVNNSFIILLLNIIQNIPRYLKTLKTQLYQEIQIQSSKQNQMIVASIEELVEQNHRKYSNLIDEKIKLLAEYLKGTIRELFDQVKQLNFSANENIIIEQEREYTKQFSGSFKQIFGQGLDQWRIQMTKENYEALSLGICTQIAKSLEQIVFAKEFHQMGSIILEKEVRMIVNFLPQVTSLNAKTTFMRLQMICETLMLESQKDMEDYLSSSAIGEISTQDLKRLCALRKDLKKQI